MTKPDTGQIPVFRTDSRLVVLHATAVDKHGRLITDLPEQAFRVFENGIPQQIKIFKREDVPVSMGLVIDNSGSMRDKRSQVEAAALRLVEDSNAHDEVFIVNFSDQASLDQDFTNSIPALKQGLARIDSTGGTAMRDAIHMSLDHLKSHARNEKQVLVVVTDGNDNLSRISLDNLLKASQDSGVLIYTVGLLNRSFGDWEDERREAKRAQRALEALAESTGGAVFFPEELYEVDRVAHQVAHDIRNQYVIAYTSTDATLDGLFRRITVTANGVGRTTVRTRNGYYAVPGSVSPAPTASQ